MRQTIRSRRFNYRPTVILLSGIVVFFLYCHSPKQTALVDLQKQLLRAGSENQRQMILNQLDRYYLNLVVPDSIKRHVHKVVDGLIHNTEASRFDFCQIKDDTIVYVLENRFRDLLRQIMIARCRRDDTTSQTLLASAFDLAELVDTGTQNCYWRPLTARFAEFDREQARIWLLADQAERLCTLYNRSAYVRSEQYGALGLQFLQQIGDDRIRQDIMQRLLVILYQFRGLYDLSFPIFQKEIDTSQQIGYYIRNTGFLFHYATALSIAGRNITASEVFTQTIRNTEKYSQIPDIYWYRTSAYLGCANIEMQSGHFKKSLAICNHIDKYSLDISQKISLYITKGIPYIYLDEYDKAEEKYEQAFDLAVQSHDISNQIIILRNIGLMYFRLTEFEKAVLFYKKAMNTLEEFTPEDIEQKCRLLLNLAETRAEQGETEKSEVLITRSEVFIRLLDLPTVKGEMLQSIGRLNLRLGRYATAHQRFREAVQLYEKNGLLRESLLVKIEMISSLMRLGDLQKAKVQLKEIMKVAAEINDAGHQIDAIGMMAEIARKEGKIGDAVHISNQMIQAIETVSARFSNPDNLIFYRHKIHEHLKNAVLYEIELGRVDSAFIKLDYLKARAAKNKLPNPKDSDPNHVSWFLNLDSLKTRLNRHRSLVSYFLTEDTLYAFILNHDNVVLLGHPVQHEEVKKEVHAFLRDLQKSPSHFRTYHPSVWDENYRSVMLRSQRLYQILFGWSALQERLKKTDVIYIVPDGILYFLPFHCLMEKTETNPRFLIQQTAVVNLPSAIFFPSPIKVHADINPGEYRVLISADRNFPGSDQFIESIKTQFPLAEELVVSKPVDHKKEVLSALNRKYHLVIFLGHSAADTLLPDSSFFDLAVMDPSGLMQTTVRLTLADLKRIDWSDTEIVCLIGCETGRGKLYQGSGLTGFSQSMLTLGAKQVLASYWRIDASMAISQMTEFFKNSPFERGSARALQRVQVQMIHELKQDNYFKRPHPYLWGSFILAQSMSSE